MNLLTPAQLAEMIKPHITALLVIDKQRGYIEPAPALYEVFGSNSDTLKALVGRMDNFIESVRAHHVPVVWTQMIEDPGYALPNAKFKMQITKTPAIIQSGHESFEIFGSAKPQEGEKVITKVHYDAFIGTDLHQHLQQTGTKTVVLIGVMTSRCVLATAFAANSLGYNVVVVEDMVGVAEKFTPEQPVALEIIQAILGFNVSSQDLLQTLSTPSPSG